MYTLGSRGGTLPLEGGYGGETLVPLEAGSGGGGTCSSDMLRREATSDRERQRPMRAEVAAADHIADLVENAAPARLQELGETVVDGMVTFRYFSFLFLVIFILSHLYLIFFTLLFKGAIGNAVADASRAPFSAWPSPPSILSSATLGIPMSSSQAEAAAETAQTRTSARGSGDELRTDSPLGSEGGGGSASDSEALSNDNSVPPAAFQTPSGKSTISSSGRKLPPLSATGGM